MPIAPHMHGPRAHHRPGRADADVAAGPGQVSAADLPQRVQAHIEAHYPDPLLTPLTAARQLGISLRWLHAALATTPRSFSQRLARCRLEQAHVLLAAERANVADVAFACGFASLATFYRQYTAVFDTTPAGRRRVTPSFHKPADKTDPGHGAVHAMRRPPAAGI